MNLYKTIDQEIKSAMLAKDKIRLETLRSVKTAIMESTTAKGASHELTEEQTTAILQRMVKQRKDSATIYEEQNRLELAEKELAEVEVLQSYLPAQLSQEELERAIGEIIVKTKSSSLRDMGKVMGAATKYLAGKAEGRAIADTVKKLLS
ncbi:MAG: GatB/YqeY domain-containing protein [Dysgonamonadaceae bacterium]|nr:GatB/YqeY domain-containing protein [Dysgonamonadaceae bacterium]MDD4730015.1 GatB/YqeY domain-containing protein [Dysgonamonadaceae bacterium]